MPPPEISRTKSTPIPEGVEVLDLTISSPSPSPSPPKATHIFITPPKGRFGHYSGKAEDYRQSSIARTRTLPAGKAVRMALHFYLLKQKQIDGIPQTLSCHLLSIINL